MENLERETGFEPATPALANPKSKISQGLDVGLVSPFIIEDQ